MSCMLAMPTGGKPGRMNGRTRVVVVVTTIIVFLVVISAAGYMLLGSEDPKPEVKADHTQDTASPAPIIQERNKPPSKPIPYSTMLKPQVSLAGDANQKPNSLYTKPLPLPPKAGDLGEVIRSLVTCLLPFSKYFNKPAGNGTGGPKALFYLNLLGTFEDGQSGEARDLYKYLHRVVSKSADSGEPSVIDVMSLVIGDLYGEWFSSSSDPIGKIVIKVKSSSGSFGADHYHTLPATPQSNPADFDLGILDMISRIYGAQMAGPITDDQFQLPRILPVKPSQAKTFFKGANLPRQPFDLFGRRWEMVSFNAAPATAYLLLDGTWCKYEKDRIKRNVDTSKAGDVDMVFFHVYPLSELDKA